MKGVVLDAASLGDGMDFSPLENHFDELILWPETTPAQVNERIRGANVVMSNKVVLNADTLKNAENLKQICIMATGMNNVDLNAAKEQKIAVRNVQAYGTASVAQHTMALMLALATSMPKYQTSVAQGEWQASSMFCLMQHPVIQLEGKNLVLVGHGELGKAVEKLAEAFGMKVHVAARPGKLNDSRPALKDLLPEADVISFHCPLTDTTRDLLSTSEFDLCKPSLLVVNAARGGIVNEQAAVDALRAGKIGGLAVDVLTEEPPTAGNPLLTAVSEPLNLIVTPHTAWLAPEARQRIINLTAQNIADWKGAS